MGKRGPQPTFTPEERAQRRKDRQRPYNTAWVGLILASVSPGARYDPFCETLRGL